MFLQASSHLGFQQPGINTAGDVEQKDHLSLVFVKRGTLKPTLVGNKQRLNGSKNRLGILRVFKPNSDPTTRVGIKPKQQSPDESGNEDRHRPRSHAAGQANYHNRDRFPGQFGVVEQSSKSQQRAYTEDNKSERLTGTG